MLKKTEDEKKTTTKEGIDEAKAKLMRLVKPLDEKSIQTHKKSSEALKKNRRKIDYKRWHEMYKEMDESGNIEPKLSATHRITRYSEMSERSSEAEFFFHYLFSFRK